jgi:hypothetical protein
MKFCRNFCCKFEPKNRPTRLPVHFTSPVGEVPAPIDPVVR